MFIYFNMFISFNRTYNFALMTQELQNMLFQFTDFSLQTLATFCSVWK